MDSTNCRISRRRMRLAGKRWILWQSGEINRSTCVICIVVWEIFEGAPTGLLVPRWRSTGVWRTSRCGTRSCRSPSWNRCHLDCFYLISLGWTHILTIFSRSRAAASSRRGTWLAGSAIPGISTHREAQWVILLVFVFCESPFSLFDLRERRLRMHTLYTVHCYTIYTVTMYTGQKRGAGLRSKRLCQICNQSPDPASPYKGIKHPFSPFKSILSQYYSLMHV